MTIANRKTVKTTVYQQLAKTRISERERERAVQSLRSAEAIVDAIVWVKERIESLGAALLNPGLKH